MGKKKSSDRLRSFRCIDSAGVEGELTAGKAYRGIEDREGNVWLSYFRDRFQLLPSGATIARYAEKRAALAAVLGALYDRLYRLEPLERSPSDVRAELCSLQEDLGGLIDRLQQKA
jgi:hypothetical protein